MIIDLHCHTVKGGPDSNLTPDELIAEARRVGLDGVCLTEHGGGWDRWDFDRFQEAHPELFLIRALEVDTEYGHVVTFGLDADVIGITRIEMLRKVVTELGGFMVSVHPFRRFFEKPPLNQSLLFKGPVSLEEAVTHPVFELTDAVEVVNGGCTLKENEFALRAAQMMGKFSFCRRDAHSHHGLGCGATVFERTIRSQEEFILELKAGRFHATNGLLQGHTLPFGTPPD